MLLARELAVLAAFFTMLLSPCVSAFLTTLSWDRVDKAYFQFEASVAAMLAPRVPVPANLHIRPYHLSATAVVVNVQPDIERFIANGVLGWISPVKPAAEVQHLLAA